MSLPRSVKLILLASLSMLLSLAAGGTAVTGQAGRAPVGLPPLALAPPPASTHPGAPSLQLSWAAAETPAGVPVGLTVQALDAAGHPDPSRGGVALL